MGMNKELLEYLNSQIPEVISDIRESLELLTNSVEVAVKEINKKGEAAFINGNHEQVRNLSKTSE